MCLDNILEKHGLECYYRGDFWNAASLLERLYRIQKGNMTRVLQKTLAYSHHMAWYTSYDHFNLCRAYELYCSAFEDFTTSGEHVDPLVLQDFALVMMHMEDFGDSLRLLAKLIDCFPRHPHFALWVLLAAVQMQHRGAREQSIEYLMYLHDISPYPYMEHDILALVAINYEQLAHIAVKTPKTRDSTGTLAKEAWCAALRLWRLKINSDLESRSANAQSNGRALTSRQKWDLLTNLGNRALEQGHFLLACDVCSYALKHFDRSEEEKTAMWQTLADGYRHLGHLDLYLKAVIYNQYNAIGEDKIREWRELVELQACSFQAEFKEVTALQKLRQLDKNFN